MYKRYIFLILLVAVVASTIILTTKVYARFNVPVKPLPRVAHAGGGYKGETYTDSIQALDTNSKKFDLFEIDLSFTADDQLVCIHDWDSSAERTFGRKFDSPPTLKRFKELVSQHVLYENCTLETLVNWLNANPSKRVVTDVKDDNVQALKKLVNVYPEIRERIIPQIYHPREYSEVKRMGFDTIILTLYRWDANMPYHYCPVV